MLIQLIAIFVIFVALIVINCVKIHNADKAFRKLAKELGTSLSIRRRLEVLDELLANLLGEDPDQEVMDRFERSFIKLNYKPNCEYSDRYNLAVGVIEAPGRVAELVSRVERSLKRLEDSEKPWDRIKAMASISNILNPGYDSPKLVAMAEDELGLTQGQIKEQLAELVRSEYVKLLHMLDQPSEELIRRFHSERIEMLDAVATSMLYPVDLRQMMKLPEGWNKLVVEHVLNPEYGLFTHTGMSFTGNNFVYRVSEALQTRDIFLVKYCVALWNKHSDYRKLITMKRLEELIDVVTAYHLTKNSAHN